MTETPALIDPLTLWGYDRHEEVDCCTCCDGYCPREDGDHFARTIDLLVSFTLDGVEYIGDRYAVVRRNIVAPLPNDAPEVTAIAEPGPMHFGHLRTTPALDFSASLADRLDRAGLTAFDTDHERIRYLVRDGEVVGWTPKPVGRSVRASNTVIRVADLPLVRHIARDCGLSLRAAAAAMNATREALA